MNVYLVGSDDGLTCIDGGWAIPKSRKQFEESLRSVGHHPRDITSHACTGTTTRRQCRSGTSSDVPWSASGNGNGNGSALQAVIDAHGSSEFVDRLRPCGAPDLAKHWVDVRMEGGPDPRKWDWPDRWFTDDFSIEVGTTLCARYTRRHTEGHHVFADLKAGLLFSGDHVLPTITPSVGFTAGLTGAAERRPLADFLGSLAKVR